MSAIESSTNCQQALTEAYYGDCRPDHLQKSSRDAVKQASSITLKSDHENGWYACNNGFLCRYWKACWWWGLFSISTKSDVYCETTTRPMLQGEQLARGIRSIKLTLEALCRHKWEALLQMTCKTRQNDCYHRTTAVLVCSPTCFLCKWPSFSEKDIEKIQVDNINHILSDMGAFQVERWNQSATFASWQTSMEDVVLLRMIYAEKDAESELHLAPMCEALSYFRASGRGNCAKFLSANIAEMRDLQQEHPESYRFYKMVIL